MIRILFVCHGSICRSPMAKYIFQDMTAKRGIGTEFYVDCAAMTNEEIGNPVYPPAAALLKSHGIDCSGYAARRALKKEYAEFDYIIGMDTENMRDMHRTFGGDPEHKLYKLLDFTDRRRDIADPWYTRDFETCCADIKNGCEGLLGSLGYRDAPS